MNIFMKLVLYAKNKQTTILSLTMGMRHCKTSSEIMYKTLRDMFEIICRPFYFIFSSQQGNYFD